LQSLRAEALSGRKRPLQARTVREAAPDNGNRTSAAAVHVAGRLRAIGSDDPQRLRLAFRLFLEGSVVDLFGIDALSDPAFQRLIDKTDDAMRSNPEMKTAMDSVSGELLGSLSGGTSVAALTAIFNRSKPAAD
jgi:hypothetical protein